MGTITRLCAWILLLTAASSSTVSTPQCQDGQTCTESMSDASVRQVIAKAKKCIDAVPYRDRHDVHPVSLITLDKDGFPTARTVVPREYNDDVSFIRLNSRKGTRKIDQIRQNNRVSLNYQDQRGRGGWLTIKGTAKLEEARDGSLDILVTAVALEGVNYNEGLMADEDGWVP